MCNCNRITTCATSFSFLALFEFQFHRHIINSSVYNTVNKLHGNPFTIEFPEHIYRTVYHPDINLWLSDKIRTVQMKGKASATQSFNLNAKSSIAQIWCHKTFLLYVAFFIRFKYHLYSIKRKHCLNVIFEISIDVSISIDRGHFQNTLHHTVYPMVSYILNVNEV